MSDQTSQAGLFDARADAPSLIEEFTIEGLYGYRTVGLSSSYAATILIARNGSGKTTLLASLDAFLRCEFARLADIQFSRIVCRLRGITEDLILTQGDVADYLSVEAGSEVHRFAVRNGLEVSELIDYLTTEYNGRVSELRESEIFKKVHAKFGYNSFETQQQFERLWELVRDRVPSIKTIRAKIQSVLQGVDIVYLPTYRRVELPLAEDKTAHRRVSIRARLGLSRKGLFSADIRFGLSDISDRLAAINQQILVESGEQYRAITANIINELIDGTYEREKPVEGNLPDKDALLQFFSRIEQSNAQFRYIGMRQAKAVILNIDRVYDQTSRPPDVEKVLNYFLSKIKVVINETRGLENKVQSFIDVCNSYLSQRDPSFGDGGHFIDDKILLKNDKNLKVSVQSVALQRKVPLDSLSSGEKQMVSLFARLYLYPGDKIVLIDEPELSLSIGWQRKILLDLVSTPNCLQVVAITHSPFVFDNALEPYAKPLHLSVKLSPSVVEDDLHDLDDLEGEI